MHQHSPALNNGVDISILVPAHNEASRMAPFLSELSAFIRDFARENRTTFEVIVAEDGSSDETLKIAKRFALTCSSVRTLHSDRRLGKGGALKAAFKKSRGKAVVFMDADGGYKPSEIPLFLKALETSDMAIGVRSADRMGRPPPFRRKISGYLFNLLFRKLFSINVHDTQAGFKAFKRAVLETLLPSIRSSGFETDAEIIAQAWHRDFDFVEVPVSYSYVRGSNVKIIRDGFAMAFSLFRIRKEIMSRRRYGGGRLCSV